MRRLGWSVLAMSLVASSAAAQQTANSAANLSTAQTAPPQVETPKRVTFTAGFDVASAYMFRGIYQEDRGAIIPPYADLGVLLYESEGGKNGITLNVGTWNSFHSGPTGASGASHAWYESDIYGSVTFTLGNWKPGALFTSYTSPNDVFKTVHELAGVLAYDDSGSAFPLSPKITIGQELRGQADGGAKKGTYLELGIRPSITVIDTEKYPLSIAIPVKAGLSLKDYYEGAAGNSRFGFFDTGLIASVPLKAGGASFEIHGGLDVLVLGDTMKALNGGDRVKPVGILGFSVTY